MNTEKITAAAQNYASNSATNNDAGALFTGFMAGAEWTIEQAAAEITLLRNIVAAFEQNEQAHWQYKLEQDAEIKRLKIALKSIIDELPKKPQYPLAQTIKEIAEKALNE
jgi:hypothetical protein